MKIMLDMDGVVADFEGHYTKLFGETPLETRREGKRFMANWEVFVANKEFENIPMLADAQKLLSFIKSLSVPVEILSSSGGQRYHDEVERQKIVWLHKHGIEYKANIVPGGSKKAEFATPWNILVDDTERVVSNYRKHGGTTILHTSAIDTIPKLRNLHLEWLGSP